MTYKGVTVGCEPKTAIYHSTYLKSTSEKPIRWSSLPKISESADTDAASPVDPYPVTFVSLSSIKMPGGGKFFPRLQRRKSKEFEDLPRLSYEQFSPYSS
ncbi:hypothetical protein EB796_020028 [Bugula neritina]|uniref:Uncharacterized protein n=1 Tax=Bugula neritina TaxID=10212 RepID=A0A7J7J8I1_BUGNE|nr:hypothetical protein EB796_020028 [Bugula neritina]